MADIRDLPFKAESGWIDNPIAGRFAGQTIIVTGAGSGIGRANPLPSRSRDGLANEVIKLTRRVVSIVLAAGTGSIVNVASEASLRG